jgi:aminoglycoside 6'-N-acetyltransferase Ib
MAVTSTTAAISGVISTFDEAHRARASLLLEQGRLVSSADMPEPAPVIFSFRPLTRRDLPLLHEWLNRPHVAEWWEGTTSFEYVEQTHGADLDSNVIWQYFARLDDQPVGYVQLYRVMGADPDWWTDETDPGARGVDQFLAHEVQLGRGLGSEMVRQFLARLLEQDPTVTKVQTDPSPQNGRAIRAYEKAGFRKLREVVTPDGPAILMGVTRAELERSFASRS